MHRIGFDLRYLAERLVIDSTKNPDTLVFPDIGNLVALDLTLRAAFCNTFDCFTRYPELYIQKGATIIVAFYPLADVPRASPEPAPAEAEAAAPSQAEAGEG